MKEMKVLLVDDEEEFVKSLSERMKMREGILRIQMWPLAVNRHLRP